MSTFGACDVDMFRTEGHVSRLLACRRTRCEYLLAIVDDITACLAGYDKKDHEKITFNTLNAKIYPYAGIDYYHLKKDTTDLVNSYKSIIIGNYFLLFLSVMKIVSFKF